MLSDKKTQSSEVWKDDLNGIVKLYLDIKLLYQRLMISPKQISFFLIYSKGSFHEPQKGHGTESQAPV